MTGTFDFGARFAQLVTEMKLDGRYRTFIQLERLAGEFPIALWHHPDGTSRRITVWCSNDYLGVGQHPDVLEAMHRALDRSGAGTGGTRNISGTNLVHVATRDRTCRSAQQGSCSSLHVRLDIEPRSAQQRSGAFCRTVPSFPTRSIIIR